MAGQMGHLMEYFMMRKDHGGLEAPAPRPTLVRSVLGDCSLSPVPLYVTGWLFSLELVRGPQPIPFFVLWCGSQALWTTPDGGLSPTSLCINTWLCPWGWYVDSSAFHSWF